MIWDSRQYKLELRTSARAILAWRKRKRLRPDDHFRIEKSFLFGAYAIRKLMDAEKLTIEVENQSVALTRVPAKIKPTRFNWHRIDKNYDFSTYERMRKPLRFVCNQLIHSYVFMPTFSQSGGLNSVCFASDREKDRFLYRIDARVAADVFKNIGSNYPRRLEWRFNHATGDFDRVVAAA